MSSSASTTTKLIAARELLQVFLIDVDDDESSGTSPDDDEEEESGGKIHFQIKNDASPSSSESSSSSSSLHSIFGEIYEPSIIIDSLLRTVSTSNDNANDRDTNVIVKDGKSYGKGETMTLAAGSTTFSAAIIRSQPYHCTPYLDLLPKTSGSAKTNKQWHEIPLRVRNSLSSSLASSNNYKNTGINNNKKKNCSNQIVRIRWIDTNYQTKQSYTWDVFSQVGDCHIDDDDDDDDATKRKKNTADNYVNKNKNNKTWVQYCKPGDLFLFSLLTITKDIKMNKKEGKKRSTAICRKDQEDEEDKEMFNNSYLNKTELLLGAYRPLRPLPSGSFHSIVIDCGIVPTPTPMDTICCTRNLYYSTKLVLTDPFDYLCVAASMLDPVVAVNNNNNYNTNPTTSTMIKARATTIELLHTILSNIIHHPYKENYHRLRLTNSKVQRYLISSWAAMQFLIIAGGFEKQSQQQNVNDYSDDTNVVVDCFLVAPTLSSPSMIGPASAVADEEQDFVLPEIRLQALELLQILLNRTLSTFVRELAQPVPWTTPTPSLSFSSSSKDNNNNIHNGDGGGDDSINRNRNRNWGDPNNQQHRRGFISDEEKWKRADRNAKKSRNGCRPNRGEAPSSKGKWER